MNDEFFLKDHFIKAAENYFLVERFLSWVQGIPLSPLTRFALMLMLEPDCAMTVERLARKMDVSEIYAQAALDELVCAGHVQKFTYGKFSHYRFSTEHIEYLNQKRRDDRAEREAKFKSGTEDLLLL
jgi:predicted transcriptional regulator